STEGFSLKYNQGPLGLAGAYQNSTDANSNALAVGSLDGTYNFGPATLFLDYFHIKTDAGFAKAKSLSGGALANTSMFINNSSNTTDRKDQLWTLGLAYNFTPATTLTVAYMDDQISQDIVGDGSMKSAYALLEYHLSKRTEVYGTVDRSTASGQALTSAASGGGTINGVGAGQTASSAVAAGLRVTF
ncbi:MAG TPA: porin, partial [Burkholderiaceae bacterium]|nr:porin [Burkholderiaceae bacterium]